MPWIAGRRRSRRPNRRPLRRSRRAMPLKRLRTSKIHYFKRTAYFPARLQSSTAAGGTIGTTGDIFRLSDVPNYNEFTDLFDQYKILKVKVTWLPRGNMSEVSQQTGVNQNGFVNLYNALDFDDITAPASVNEILQYDTLKIKRSNQRLTRYFTPAQLGEMWNNGVTSGYSVRRRPLWIDCADSSAQHYGMKTLLEYPQFGSGAPAAQVVITYDLMVTYYLAFKHTV